MSLAVLEYTMTWPELARLPDGAKPFLAWGPRWGYHYDDEGNWRKGRLCRKCVIVVPDGLTKCQKCGGVAEGQHGGLDKLPPAGAAADTVALRIPEKVQVIEAGWQDTYGNRLILQLQRSVARPAGAFLPWLTMGHFSRLVVAKGQVLEPGTLLGYMGATGNVTGPHCHLQLEEFMPFPRRVMRLNIKS